VARRAPRKKGKGFGIEKMSDDIRSAAVDALRNAAKEVLNDLGTASPNWSGIFRDSWYVETFDGKQATKVGGENGKYNLFNIPQLKTQGRNAKGQFTKAVPISRGKIELFIGNSSPYATQAMDLEPGKFAYPGFEPAGEEQPRGKRQDGIRGKLEKPGGNRSTAPLDWYSTYMEGGAFRAAFNKGAKAGFLEARNRPRFNRPAQ
jgi:hypothetical protein